MSYEYLTITNTDYHEFLRECVHAINSDGWERVEEQKTEELPYGTIYSQELRREESTDKPDYCCDNLPEPKKAKSRSAKSRSAKSRSAKSRSAKSRSAKSRSAKYQMISSSLKREFNTDLENLCAKDNAWEPHGALVVAHDILGNPLYCQMMKLPG